MPQLPKLILAANPMQEPQIKLEHAAIAHIAYRVDPGPKLMRLSRQMPGQGGFLFFGCDAPSGNGLNFFLQQVLRECGARKAQGVVADLPREAGNWAMQLDRVLHQNGLRLYVPECHQDKTHHAKLLISTAISGGTLRARLSEAIQSYGADRVVPALELTAEDFVPPNRSGKGTPLSLEELRQLRERLKPNVFWSPDLCVRYFTYFDQGKGHLVLFDDRETLRAKMRLIGELGIGECLCAWGDLQE